MPCMQKLYAKVAAMTTLIGLAAAGAAAGVCYARTTIRREKPETIRLAWQLDYFGKIWLNGRLVKTVDGGHGCPKMPLLIPVELKAGDNLIFLKIHSGSRGNNFAVHLEQND